jgi:hypothetical protein
MDLSGSAHPHGDDAGQQIDGNSQPRAFWNIVHPADDFNAATGPSREEFQQNGQGCVVPSIPGGTMPLAMIPAFSKPG